MTDDRDERRVQAIADALREALKSGTRIEILGPFAEAILSEELDPDDDAPPSAGEPVGAGARDEHFFG
jgi:hypothetical protein